MFSRWYLIWIALFIGPTIFTGVTFAVSTVSGLSMGLATLAAIVILGVAIWMFFRGYMTRAWGAFLSLTIGSLATISLLNGFVVGNPDIPQDLFNYFEEEGVPYAYSTTSLNPFEEYDTFDDYESDGRGDYYIDTTESIDLVIDYSTPEISNSILILFDGVESLNGQWGVQRGTAHITGPVDVRVNSYADFDPADEDYEFQTGDDADTFLSQPFISVDIPANLQKNERYTINATATFVIPSDDGQSIEMVDVERSFDLILADQDYWLYIDEYQAYERAQNVTEFPLVFVALILGIGGLGYGGHLIRDGAFTERTTGGLSLVIKRMSGYEKLGIEAHDLNTLDEDVRNGETEGVFVGYVNAQSPAGRGGLRTGDIITHIDSKAINKPNDINRMIKGTQRGETKTFLVRRHGNDEVLTIKF